LFPYRRRDHRRSLHQRLEHRERHAFPVRRQDKDLRIRNEVRESWLIYPAQDAYRIRNAERVRPAPGVIDLSVTSEHKVNVRPPCPNLGERGEEVQSALSLAQLTGGEDISLGSGRARGPGRGRRHAVRNDANRGPDARSAEVVGQTVPKRHYQVQPPEGREDAAPPP